MALPSQNHRITKPTFVPARPVGLAVKLPYAFALYAWFPISAEGTFARLRYFLGGDRPSQTTHQTRFPDPDNGPRLDTQTLKGGISTATPSKLAPRSHSLPPMLHISAQESMSSCSKGSRGLSVLPRVLGIFTENSISLSLWLRQCGSRYAIRAGRNLPDKEFRYLRTVIVTAAVYRGFNSWLRLR